MIHFRAVLQIVHETETGHIMRSDIDRLYGELKGIINRDHLTAISSDIISRYRERDIRALSWYASLLDIRFSEKDLNRLFAKIIQAYHPDKLTKILADIEARYRGGDAQGLQLIKNAFAITGAPKSDVREKGPRFEYEEEYRYDEEEEFDEEDFYGEETEGAGMESYDEEGGGLEEEDILDEGPEIEEFGFIEAINKYIFGNLDFTVNLHDMANLEGELNLSDYEIVDLKGIEHCVNVTSVNISGNDIVRLSPISALAKLESLFAAENSIDSIDCLEACRYLRELDVSYNDIEDASVLLKLGNLRYVNLIGNPLEDTSVITELAAREVLVLY